MIPSTFNNIHNKQLIYGLVSTLTDLDPNIIEIRQPIEESNLLVKEITQNIELLKTKNDLIKFGHLAVLEKNLPSLKSQLEGFIDDIKTGKLDAEKLVQDFNVVINTLTHATNVLEENDALKTDALSIVALNNIKVKNIQNQIKNADHQIEILERFNAITLYHLNDTINSNKKDKDMPVLVEIERVMAQVLNKMRRFKSAAFYLAILSGYNYLASNYHIAFERVERIANGSLSTASTSSDFQSEIDTILSVIDAAGMVMMTLGSIFVFFTIFMMTQREGGSSNMFSTVIIAITTMMLGVAAPIVAEKMFGSSEQVQYIEKTSLFTFDFWNFGFTGTLIFFGLTVFCVIMAVMKHKEKKQFESLIQKLSDSESKSTNTDKHQSTLVQAG
ncbi:hypothetical protein [Acinetobacter radioresistens]|uniref:hypothetical protein n=1 Tax=Acinetobacter radioresistens TaxID=40216 RepID=UPI00028E8A8E|nr:hypothetical protein [Acinetobacter radioresistens]BBL22218.1 hypothetical protein ACRAD_28890 [Acinetobacter radioresistens DSM 6976 = NBRC 102413 = CIP 103788]